MERRVQLQQQQQLRQTFTASEVAEFEYCPLVWWYEQFEPMVQADTEELFAELVAMEHEHGPQATSLPEYQVIEQLLVRRGAFEEGIEQHRAHAEEVAEIEEERRVVPDEKGIGRRFVWVALVIAALAFLLIIASLLLGTLK